METSPSTRQANLYLTTSDLLDKIKRVYPDLGGYLNQQAISIPGTASTKTLSSLMKHSMIEVMDMTPQGLAILPHYVIVSAYSAQHIGQSVLYVLDRKSGIYLKTIVLPGTPHVGGIAYDERDHILWVAYKNEVSGESGVGGISLARIESYDLNQEHSAIAFDRWIAISTLEDVSYLAYAEGRLYLGQFVLKGTGQLVSYRVTKNIGLDQSSEQKYETTERIQGLTFYRGYVFLSQSYGRKDSQLLVFKWNEVLKSHVILDEAHAFATLTLPPYLEQTAVDLNRLYLLFESASLLYRDKPDFLPIDRIISLAIDQVLKEKEKNG